MKRGVFIFWSIFLAAAVFRFVLSFNMEVPDLDTCLRQKVEGIGTIVDEPERKESGQVMIVRAEELSNRDLSLKCSNDVLIRMKTNLYPRLSYGDQLSFEGKLSKPFNFRSDNGRSFNYEGYLAKDNVFYEIKSAEAEFIRSNKEELSIQGSLYSLKRGFVGNLERTLGEPHAALAAGLVVGEKSALGSDLLNDFRVVGLIHIVVLSGYNITIVADAMRRLLASLPRVWGIIVGGIGIVLFGILVGGGATVVRSCFMAGVALTGDLIRRDYSAARALVFAGLIMLIQNPLILLNDPSFQLSFLATLGLILLASPVEKKLEWIPEKFGMRGIVASTIATQIFVSPYLLYMMGQLSIIGTIVNIIVLPFIPATMLAVFLTGSIGFFSTLIAEWVGWIAHLLLSYELLMVNYFAKFPLAAIEIPPFSSRIVIGFYFLLSAMLFSTAFQFKFTKKSST